MIDPKPIVIEGRGLRLEPLTLGHAPEIAAAAGDGCLWELRFTSVPAPGEEGAYIQAALDGQYLGHMLPWAIRDLGTGAVLGTTRYHDIMRAIDRVEIGYTFYAKSRQRSSVNTSCKLLLLEHGFDVLGCKAMGLRTDILNTASQQAIEKLGARRDGVIRHYGARRDGSARDTVMYSILLGEWPAIRARLEARIENGGFARPE